MSNDFTGLIRQKPENEGICFAVVDPATDVKYIEDGITYYPTEVMLRTERLSNKNVIWLSELPDKNCKRCYGTGKLGTRKSLFPLKEIEDVLIHYLNDEDLRKIISDKLIAMMKLPTNLKEPLEMLIDIAKDDLGDDNITEVATKYAKQIQKDFMIKSIEWCSCFLSNYAKEVTRVRRQLKFEVN